MKTDKTVNQEEAPGKNRRNFVGWFWKLLAAVACIEITWVTGALFSSRQRKKDTAGGKNTVMDAGMVGDLKPGDVKAVPQGQFYLTRLEDGSFLALSRTCTHLGCSVPWDKERQKFICPCHGSTFDLKGQVLTPPALRPLDYYPVKIENGLIKVDISKSIKRETFAATQTAQA